LKLFLFIRHKIEKMYTKHERGKNRPIENSREFCEKHVALLVSVQGQIE